MMGSHPGMNRTATSSTASTMYSSFAPGSAASSQTTMPSSRTSSKLFSPIAGRFPRKDSNESSRSNSNGSRTSAEDELDRWGYIYSLRVAALQQRLASQPPAGMSSPTMMSPTSPTSPSFNQSRFSVSSAGSRMTTHNGMRSPEIPMPGSTNGKEIKRKKSGLRLSIGGSKNDLKLPKEFLLEFWGQLSSEEGDMGWQQAVRGFLLLVQKKGTKTSPGANMREIPTLLQTFATCLPPPGPQSAQPAEHRAHLLRMLYHALPLYFKSEKDQELLFRLQAELQSQMYNSPVEPEAQFSPTLMMHGMAAQAAARSPMSPARSPAMQSPGLHPNRPASGQIQEIRRKPSPARDGELDMTDTGNLVGIVGLIWGVAPYVLDGDLANLKRYGQLERLYLVEIKNTLSTLALATDQASKARQHALSARLGSLIAAFPDLTRPSSPGAAAAETSADAFFMPPRKAAVFAHLVRRAAEAGNTIRAAELLEHCQNVWNVESRAEKEREVEELVRRWECSIGTREERELGNRLANASDDLVACLSPAEPTPRVLEHIRDVLHSELAKCVHSIFPTTDALPPAPPPSILPILQSAPDVFLRSQPAAKVLGELADELRGAAVGEYVMAATEMGIHSHEIGAHTGESGKDAVMEGFEKLASWIIQEVTNVRQVWHNGLGKSLDPAAIIIHKQLPLFLAEIQVLETATSASSDVFVLYEVTARLLALWDKLCPGLEHGFDLDAFFEPHVVTWLRETEVNETHQWVARTIGMDQWIPEGEGRFSQSVTDLFEFIRNSTQLVRDLPLSEYKRAVFLIDLSKTASIAVTEYSRSVHALFQSDMTPAKSSAAKDTAPPSISMGAMSGKAGAWLAKGRHAVQKVESRLDRKKVDVFVVPAAACVKLTNMGAANLCVDDLAHLMEADESARVVREHKLADAFPRPKQYRFSVTVLRGQNLLTKSAKPADALVTVTDKATGERLFKSRTVLETEDPKWEQTFEVIVSSAIKTLDLTALDRQLMGKHDAIGSRSFKLDPAMFSNVPVRDVVLPLSPRGVVHLRVALDAGEIPDVTYHLTSASRVLENTASDMTLEIVDCMAEFIAGQLSRSALLNVTKPLRDKKKPRIALTEVEISNSLSDVCNYLDANFSVFNETLTPDTRLSVMLAIWRRVVDILISLLIPPLADRPAPNTMLSPPEVDVVFKWLQQLKAFFNAEEDGVEHGVPSQALQVGGYKDMLMIGQYLDLPLPALRERASAAVRATSSVVSPTTGMRSLSLGGAVGSRARVGEDNERMAEILLRILRMRPDTTEFLRDQLSSLISGKVSRQGGLL